MAIKSGFDCHELDDLGRSLWRTAQEKYPEEVKPFLRKEGNKLRRIMRGEYRSRVGKKTGNLTKGIGQGRPHKYGNDFQLRVYNEAPHAFLIEHGHSNVKKKPSSGSQNRIPAGTPVVMVPGREGPLFIGRPGGERYIPGKYPAAHAAMAMKQEFPGDVEDFLDEMFRKGLEM